MKTKALVLGAKPPFVGPWVPIEEDKLWQYSVECSPIADLSNGRLTIRVRDSAGATLPFNVAHSPGGIRGTAVQAEVGELEEVNSISIFIEEVEDE